MPELPEREIPPQKRTFVVEVGKIPEFPAEKEGLIERVWEPELGKPVTDHGQVLVTSTYAKKPTIVLPLTRATYLNPVNWHKPIVFAIRWLLTWAQRIIKMNQGRVVFQEN